MEQSRKINRKSPCRGVNFEIFWLVGILSLIAFGADAVGQEDPEPAVALGRIHDRAIVESSGIVNARQFSDGNRSNAIWTFNDSGGSAVLFRVNLAGHTEATLVLEKAENRDWETMSRFSFEKHQFLVVGDVGDNLRKRKKCQLYLVKEPQIEASNLAQDKTRKPSELNSVSDRIEFTYEDGPRNCEAMSVCPDDLSFWFVEKIYVDGKQQSPPGVYMLSNSMTAPKVESGKPQKNVAVRIADFPVRNVTGMAFSPDGKRLVIRDYFNAWLYEKAKGKSWRETIGGSKPKRLALPLQSQGEAICFSPDSKSFLVTSEMAGAIIWQVNFELELQGQD